MIFQRIYTKTSQASILIPVYTGIRNYKALTLPFKILFYFFVLGIFFEIQASLMIELYGNNMPGQHVYTVIQFLVFSTVFYLHTKNSLIKTLLTLNAGIFIVVALIGMRQGMKVTNDLSRGYCAFFMTLYVLGYLYYLFTRDDVRFLSEYPMFWVCIGMLIYFPGQALYAMMKQPLLEKFKELESYADIGHAVLNFIANCLYAQTFKCLGRQKI